MKINYVTSFDAGSPENEWIMRDRIPELMEVLHRKALNTPDKYNNKVIFTVRLKQPKSGEMTTMDISEKAFAIPAYEQVLIKWKRASNKEVYRKGGGIIF